MTKKPFVTLRYEPTTSQSLSETVAGASERDRVPTGRRVRIWMILSTGQLQSNLNLSYYSYNGASHESAARLICSM